MLNLLCIEILSQTNQQQDNMEDWGARSSVGVSGDTLNWVRLNYNAMKVFFLSLWRSYRSMICLILALVVHLRSHRLFWGGRVSVYRSENLSPFNSQRMALAVNGRSGCGESVWALGVQPHRKVLSCLGK